MFLRKFSHHNFLGGPWTIFLNWKLPPYFSRCNRFLKAKTNGSEHKWMLAGLRENLCHCSLKFWHFWQKANERRFKTFSSEKFPQLFESINNISIKTGRWDGLVCLMNEIKVKMVMANIVNLCTTVFQLVLWFLRKKKEAYKFHNDT